MKKLKRGFELIGRLLLVFVTLFTNFAGIMPVLASNLSYTKGEVIDSVNSKGSTDKQGDAKITKTVTKTNEDGVYQIDLSVKGKDKVTNKSETAPIYAAVVLDNSGSMDNCTLCLFSDNKYELAKKGTKSFARTLISKYSSAQLALVTFSTNSNVVREFKNENFNNTNFPSPNGLTYLSDGISTAKKLLDDKKRENSDAKLYMVILTDGYPEEYDISNEEAANKAKVSATNAKQNGIEIFTIGYDTTRKTKELLKGIATDENHFAEADEQSVADKFNDIAGSIEVRTPAGTNATLTDIIGDEFTYVDGSKSSNDITVNGKEVSINVDDVTEAGKNYSFKVRINKDAKDGLHVTNASCKLEYKNVDNEDTNLELDKSAKVYWEAQKYTYTINYYKDSVNGQKLGTVSYEAPLNTKINLTNDELNKYKPVGYKDGVSETALPYTIKDGINVINVVYKVRDDLKYTVEYYKETDDNKEEKISDDKDNTNNAFFGQKIDLVDLNKYKNSLGFGYKDGSSKDLPYTIKEEGNVIKVCYERRRDMSYTVRYLEKDTNKELYGNKIVANKTYNDTYEEEAKDAPFGYKLVSDKKQSIKLDKENNVVTFYYEKRTNMSYKVRYVELVGNDEVEILDTKTVTDKTYNETYEENAKEAPLGYKLVGDNKQTITLSEDNMTITFYYEKRTDMSYTVKYLEKGTGKSIISDKKVIDKTYNEDVTEYAEYIYGYDLINEYEQSIKLDSDNKVITFYYEKIKINYTVKYLEKDTNKELSESITKQSDLFSPVEEEAIEIRGYKLIGEDKVVIELSKEYENLVIFYYEKVKVNYTIKYLDSTTKEEIIPSVSKDGLFFDKITEKATNIDGYNLVSLGEVTIELNEDNNEIVFYYDKVVEVVKTGVEESNNNYLLFIALLGSITALGYSLKKRFN